MVDGEYGINLKDTHLQVVSMKLGDVEYKFDPKISSWKLNVQLNVQQNQNYSI